jgi:hypothetical protein
MLRSKSSSILDQFLVLDEVDNDVMCECRSYSQLECTECKDTYLGVIMVSEEYATCNAIPFQH